jgi:hypothetical protein
METTPREGFAMDLIEQKTGAISSGSLICWEVQIRQVGWFE